MSSGDYPTYSYRPPPKSALPNLRSCSRRRARLWIGGTYFRVREVGRHGNLISVQTIESEGVTYLVVTNENSNSAESVSGPVTVPIFDLASPSYQDYWEFTNLTSEHPSANYYSTSLRIAFRRQEGLPFTLDTATDLGEFHDSKLFTHPGKLSIKTQKIGANFSPPDVISVRPRIRIYVLSRLEIPATVNPETGVVSAGYSGWDIADLRTQINTNDPWIEMLPRSGPIVDSVTGVSTPNPNPADVQDTTTDDPVMSDFGKYYLSGGDGMPEAPNLEITGPTRSIVHVNYSEAPNGTLVAENTVYEWVGSTNVIGAWQPY